MMKQKMFLNTSDIENICGVSDRSARNIMNYIKAERDLPEFRSVSIFDFCSVFNVPLQTVFRYINSTKFDLLPIDEQALRRQQSYERSDPKHNVKPLYCDEFEPFIYKSRKKSNDVNGDKESEAIGA